jgi:hypothetical protein
VRRSPPPPSPGGSAPAVRARPSLPVSAPAVTKQVVPTDTPSAVAPPTALAPPSEPRSVPGVRSAPVSPADNWSQPLALHQADVVGDPGERHILRGLD